MATGYTHELERMNYDVKKWLMESIPRAMGMCVRLREEKLGMSVAEMREKIIEDPNYYDDLITVDTIKLSKLKKKTQAEWVRDLDEDQETTKRAWEERLEKWKFKRNKHKDSLKTINHLHFKATDATTKQILEFAQSQLHEVILWEYKREYEPKLSECPYESSWESYRDAKISYLKEYISSCEDSKKETNKINKEHLDAFDNYMKFVANIDKEI